jgi:hypothetical protein
MKLRFYIDAETSRSHIHRHEVTEQEVEDILAYPCEDSLGHEGSRIAVGQTQNGRGLSLI